MNLSSKLPIIAGVFIAVLLIFLFSQSQVEKQKHQNTVVDILTLLEYDSRIKQQVVELHSGSKKNYGGLVATTTAIKQIIGDFKTMQSISSLKQASSSVSLLESLEQAINIKFEKIEVFKRENAVLKNSLHYLPKYIDTLIETIASSSILDDHEKTQVSNLLHSITSKAFVFEANIKTDRVQLVQTLRDYKSILLTILPKLLHAEIEKAFTHTTLIMRLHDSLATSTEVILSSESSDIVKLIYRELNRAFRQQVHQANRYRFWLLVVSLMLLGYLTYVFFKWQLTSKRLKKSMVDLEFEKYAVDEHSIVSIADANGDIVYANEKFCNVSQYSHHELVGHSHRILKSDLNPVALYKGMWETLASGEKWQGVFANKSRDGSVFWVDATILPRLDKSGKPYQFIGICTDITAQKKAEQEAALLARFPSENPDPVIRLNALGELLYANPASKQILTHWNMQNGKPIPEEWCRIVQRVLIQGQKEEHEIKVGKTDYSIIFTPITNEDYVNLYARNVTDIKQAEHDLNYQATHDSLTGLINRFAFESKLEESLKKAQIESVHSILLYIDLDQFKIVNDTCGHVAGDELLRQIAEIFDSEVRDSDALARLGGDEFGVILNNCNIEHGQLIGDKILKSINDFRFAWEGNSFEIGASIGLVEIFADSNSVVSLMGEADLACYAAKDAGRNCLIVYRNEKTILKRRNEMQWASLIPSALAENRFVLYGQTIKPLSPVEGDLPHYEILIRLQSEEGQLIPPGAFIPAAERYGLMQSLDMWVITTSIEMLSQYLSDHPDSPIQISINLSGQSIGSKPLLEYIQTIIKKHRIDAALVTFEITETSAISNLTTAIKFIKKLKSLGHKFALDDFGSGLSSFAYLKNLPVDFLKIDGSFVKDILDDPIDAAMVQSINQIGHVMNIQTIAEFVENSEVEQRLAGYKVDYAQGYGIRKPRPFSEILQCESTGLITIDTTKETETPRQAQSF